MLVVLPFQNLTGDPNQDFLSDGFTEEMITELSRLQPERLAVIARTSAMHYRNTQEGIDQIGRELGVQYVLEGSMRRDADRIRITAQLIQVQDQTHVWAQSYERNLRDVMGLQSDVANAIGHEIELKLSPQPALELRRTRPVDPQAYDAYLQGRYFWNRRTRQGLEKAIEYFDQAIGKDPTAPQFYAGLADAYALLGSTPDSSIPRPEAMEKARAAARKALQMDETLAEAHTSLAFVEMHYDWDWPGAEKEFRRALQLNPNYATAHHWYAYYLIALGRKEESVQEIRRAQDLDPLSLIIMRDVGDMLFYSRRYEEGIAQCRQALERDPNFYLAHILLGSAYQQKKEYAEMMKEYQAARAGAQDEAWALAAVGQGEAALGNRTEAGTILAELKRRSQHGQEVAYAIAAIEAVLGRRDEAFLWLDAAYRQRIGSMILLKVDPTLDSLRDDPRFGELLRRMRLDF
jgi:TolB-like protein/predicted Zn-dependent protease